MPLPLRRFTDAGFHIDHPNSGGWPDPPAALLHQSVRDATAGSCYDARAALSLMRGDTRANLGGWRSHPGAYFPTNQLSIIGLSPALPDRNRPICRFVER
jgi:hypothetical protein